MNGTLTYINNSTELTSIQKLKLQGKVCPYCDKETIYVDSSVIYGKSYGMIYLCKPCRAYVGVHKGTNIALGRLADKDLRYYKKEAHQYFDMIWKEGHEERTALYKHLSDYLEIPVELTHIGMFSVTTCQKVTEWSKMILNDSRRLDIDFGLDVKREHYNIN